MPRPPHRAAVERQPDGADAHPDDSLERLLTGLADRTGAGVVLEVHSEGHAISPSASLPAAGPRPDAAAPRLPAEVVAEDGVAYGRLWLTGATAAHAEDVRAVAAVIGERLGRQAAARRAWDRRAAQVRRVVEDGSLTMHYQPIVSLADGSLVGVEGLARFPERDDIGPDRWFADATAAGLGIELEVAAVEQAIDDLAVLPPDLYLSVNVSPAAAASPVLRRALRRRPLDRLVFEITEHAEVTDYAALNRTLKPLRRGGLRLAVDDAGAGFASLRHILRMTPDIIKLDRSLARGIDKDPVLRALTYSIAAFASATDAAVVAEGIESESELDALRFLGVAYGQGYHLSRPDTVEAVAELAAVRAAEAAPSRSSSAVGRFALNPSSAG